MIAKIKARILKMTKDDMRICSSRCIWASLVDETTNKEYHVTWAKTPMVVGFSGMWSSKFPNLFDRAWEKCEVGDEVWLYHPLDSNFNYFVPLEDGEYNT